MAETESKVRRSILQINPSLARALRQCNLGGKKSSLNMNNIWRELSRINRYSGTYPRDSVATLSAGMSSLTERPSRVYTEEPQEPHGLEGYIPIRRVPTSDEDIHGTYEKFPVHVTPLMDEDQHWGCFYTFPELYDDRYSPVVRFRSAEEVPELVGGVLTRSMVSTGLTYLKRTPILGDFVYIKLDVSQKHLVNIEVLQHYKFLVYLDLSSNLLTELTVLSRLPYLQYLSVAFNRLSTVLEYDVPQGFLTEVNYKYNSIKKIRDLTVFWSITVLDLSHNNIKTISGLENLYYLRRLDLSFNHIQRLENLNHLRLTWLDVSYNNISSFEHGANVGLWTLLHLEYLNLNENQLTSIRVFSGCTRLRQLYARNNRLSVLLELAVYMRQMRRLTDLDLRANPICEVPGYKKVVINTFPILLCLDAEELDPVETRLSKMDMRPEASTHATHRLLRLLYIEQLSKSKISPYVLPADTHELPLIVIVGYEAVGKGTLSRRLASKFSDHVVLAKCHTTATIHLPNQYIVVTRDKFDEMLLNGDFLTYSERNGESYGLSREEAYVKDGKAKIVTMNFTSALMLKLRGLRPYLILASVSDKQALQLKQSERKIMRDKLQRQRSFEKSTLQVLVSGTIIIAGILNEILLTLPEGKEKSAFQLESECSLLMDSDARKAARDYASEVNILTLLASASNSIDGNECGRGSGDNSLCSLYKESQTNEDVSNNANGGQGSYDDTRAKKMTPDNGPVSQKPTDGRISSVSVSRPKSVDFSRYQSFTWKGLSGMDSMKSSKSVTFTSQDIMDNIRNNYPDDPAGMLVEPASEKDSGDKAHFRSLSTRLQHLPTGCGDAGGSMEDADLWMAFLIDTGIMQISETNAGSSDVPDTVTRRDTKIDDPDFIINQLSYYNMTPSYSQSRGTENDYEDAHRKSPGLFYDTVSMDDPEEAYKKMKRIIRDIFGSQKTLKPMFDIDFGNQAHLYPFLQERIDKITKQISPQRLFF